MFCGVGDRLNVKEQAVMGRFYPNGIASRGIEKVCLFAAYGSTDMSDR